MESSLDLPQVRTLFAKDFVSCWIDVDRMTGGKEFIARMGAAEAGLPWWAFLDAEGKRLADADDATGSNVGCPYREDEIEAFRGLLLQVRKNLTEAEVDAIAAALHEAGERGEKARRAAQEKAEQAAGSGNSRP